MGCVALAVCLLRFWTRVRDRLFAIFAVAVALLAVQHVLQSVVGAETEILVYMVRAVVFGLLLVAIVDKNRRPG